MKPPNKNTNPEEIEKFDAIASDWWNPLGAMKPLHLFNPIRLDYVDMHSPLKDKAVLDVGCGGGLLSEAMAKAGAEVSAIDMSESVLTIAKQHAKDNAINIDYQQITPEDFATKKPATFDIVTCMELLEHVPDPQSVITACATLVKPGGTVYFSTVNRNVKSYLLAIVGAEYIMNLLPKGTHHYSKFIRPSELRRFSENADLDLEDISGIHYQPFQDHVELCQDTSVNYLICFTKGTRS